MRFCVQCGNALQQGATFCTQCGAPAAPSSASTTGDDAPTQMARAQREPGQAGLRLPSTDAPASDDRSSHEAPDQPVAASTSDAAPQGYPEVPSTSPQARHAASGSLSGQWQATDSTSDSQPSAPQATQEIPQAGVQSNQGNQGYASTSPAQGYESSHPAHAPQNPGQQGQSYQDQGAHAYDSQAPGGQASQGYASQGYASAGHPQDAQGYTSAMPHQGAQSQQGYASQQPSYGSQQHGSQQQYTSRHPQQAWQSQGQQGGGQRAWGGQGQGVALDWKPLLPGLARVAMAILLSMTALGNWWVVDSGSTDNDYATHASVLPLIGCIGVTLAAIAQIALLPQFLGGTVPAIGRFAIRVGLCVPALIAVIIAIVTTLGDLDSDKFSPLGVTLLAMAIGFAVMGLDDGHDAVPADTLRWVTVALAGLGILLTVLSFIQVLNAEVSDTGGPVPTTKAKWLVWGLSYLFLILVGALIAWVALTRPAFGLGLVSALAASVALSALFLGWFIDDELLYYTTLARNWHGAPLLALALAMAAAGQVSGVHGDTATDDGATARRLTSWTMYGYGLAAAAALFTGLVFIGGHTQYSPAGETWFAVLMFVTALVYGATAYLLKTHPMGRLVAVGATAIITLTILITFASAKGVGSVNEMFTEGAFLWVPVLAALALTVPPSVRRVAGGLMPQQRQGGQAPAMQTAGAAPQHQQFDQQNQGQQYTSQQPMTGAPAQYDNGQHGNEQYNSNNQYGSDQQWNSSPQGLAPNEWEARTQQNRRPEGQ